MPAIVGVRLQKGSGTVSSRRPNKLRLSDWDQRTYADLRPSATTRHGLGRRHSTRFGPVSPGRPWPAGCSVSNRMSMPEQGEVRDAILDRLNRRLRTLCQCTSTFLQVESEQELLQSLCEILVAGGDRS